MKENPDELNENAPARSPTVHPTLADVRLAELTANELHILQHSLGVDQYGQGQMYRNHFCAGEDDEPACRALVAKGFMKQHATTAMLPYFNCNVTDEGKRVMKERSPKAPILTRSQKRYREFLDADSGVSFREWLGWRKSEPR